MADDSTTTYDDKVARVLALRAQWEYEDNEEEALDGDALQTCQRIRCRELGLVVFRFKLYEAQIEAIYTLFYEKKDFVAPPTQGTWRSNDYVNAVRLVDMCMLLESMEWVGEPIIYLYDQPTQRLVDTNMRDYRCTITFT